MKAKILISLVFLFSIFGTTYALKVTNTPGKLPPLTEANYFTGKAQNSACEKVTSEDRFITGKYVETGDYITYGNCHRLLENSQSFPKSIACKLKDGNHHKHLQFNRDFSTATGFESATNNLFFKYKNKLYYQISVTNKYNFYENSYHLFTFDCENTQVEEVQQYSGIIGSIDRYEVVFGKIYMNVLLHYEYPFGYGLAILDGNSFSFLNLLSYRSNSNKEFPTDFINGDDINNEIIRTIETKYGKHTYKTFYNRDYGESYAKVPLFSRIEIKNFNKQGKGRLYYKLPGFTIEYSIDIVNKIIK